MANDINSVTLTGRLTREAELRYTNSGTAICRFSLAVNRRKRSGEVWEDEVSYFDVVLWGKQGESLSRYLERGKQVAVSGELRQNRWEQEGKNRSKVEIVANNVQLLGNPSANSNGFTGGGAPSGPRKPSTSGGYDDYRGGSNDRSSMKYDGPEQFDDDIPF